jgi:hypothetical protein
MKQPFFSENWSDENENPAGGVASGRGFTISWQNGPLGRDENRREPNGAFVETIIAAACERIIFYQQSRFNCEENQQAVEYLVKALETLDSRTKNREARLVEGTHAE